MLNWECFSVDGHNKKIGAYRSRRTKKPLFIVGNTVKGKGVSYMENKPIWHYRSPTAEEFSIGINEIEKGF